MNLRVRSVTWPSDMMAMCSDLSRWEKVWCGCEMLVVVEEIEEASSHLWERLRAEILPCQAFCVYITTWKSTR